MRAGFKRHESGALIPDTATVFTHNGKCVYISGLSMNNVRLRIIGSTEFLDVDWSEGMLLLRQNPLIEAISIKK